MKDILSEIIAHKRIEIEQQKQAVSLSQLQEQAAAMMQETVGTGASGTTPVRSIADEVAAGMKKWALEMGVTHYTHWFHPLTEGNTGYSSAPAGRNRQALSRSSHQTLQRNTDSAR